MTIEDTARTLAIEEIASRTELHKQTEFPFDLWEKMAAAGLLGAATPEKYGGLGLDLGRVMGLAEILLRYGRNRGMVLSWLSHNMIAAFFLDQFGTEEQKQEWLTKIASGEVTPAASISEPGAGAHPKRLKTSAVREGDQFVINGEKAFLTNGPIARLYIVLAITSEDDGRKKYSMFLVPRDAPGLGQTTAGSVDYILPSLHGGLSIENVHVPASSMLGSEGDAYETKAKPFREWETAVGTGSGIGAMQLGLDRLILGAKTAGTAFKEEDRMTIGRLRSIVDTVRRLGLESVAQLGKRDEDSPQPLLIGQGVLNQAFRETFHGLREKLGVEDEILDRFWPAPSGESRPPGQVDRANLLKMADLALAEAMAADGD